MSIPAGILSKITLLVSKIDNNFLQKPNSSFIRFFSIAITVKSFFPAIPVIVPYLCIGTVSPMINVP